MAVVDYHVSLNSLSHAYPNGARQVSSLEDVSINVPGGQFLSVIGPSGCGKSTLLRIIGGLLKPSAGTVLVDGKEPDKAQRTREIGFVFQDSALLPWRSIRANVRLPLEVAGAGPSATDVEALLDVMGLAEFQDFYPYQLSGGLQQRVAIARALVFDPRLLLMDEPFGALDEITRGTMRYELLRVWQREASVAPRKTVVFVTHSVPEAVAMSDRVVVLSPRPGKVRADVEIELPRPRNEDSERSREFLDYAEYIRSVLREAA
jgi:NitT/TauT family transport system ATP-binding protein